MSKRFVALESRLDEMTCQSSQQSYFSAVPRYRNTDLYRARMVEV